MNPTLQRLVHRPPSHKNSKSRRVLMTMVALLCLSPSAHATWLAPTTAAAHTAAKQGNEFAVDLFKRVAAKPGNAFVSPWSVRTALSMTALGARGKTLAELSKALRIGPKAGNHAGVAELNRRLQNRKGAAVSMANRLWVQMGFMLEPAFLTAVGKHYNGGTAYVDLSSPKPEVARINAWVAKHTGGHIKDLLEPADVAPEAGLVLTNATYFKAGWTNTFDGGMTRNEPFYVRPGHSVSTPMMGQKFKSAPAPRAATNKPAVRYEKRQAYEMLELPYGTGEMSMLILLPNTKSPDLDRFVKALTVADFKRPVSEISAPLQVRMPKFKRTHRQALRSSLQAMGMPTVFTDNADFRGVAAAPLQLSNVVHQAFIAVDETGTEAAAATAVIMMGGAPTVASMIVDRPFVYAIQDTASGALLYMGRMDDPTKL